MVAFIDTLISSAAGLVVLFVLAGAALAVVLTAVRWVAVTTAHAGRSFSAGWRSGDAARDE